MTQIQLSSKQLIEMYKQMKTSRLLDEKLIHIYKKGQGYFWIGSPGEEAFSVPLGLLVQKGQGLAYDWLHLHYRCTGTVVAMGVDIKNVFRLMLNKKTDPFTEGKNFIHHYCIPEWNIPPITSTIETQYSWAIGTAHAQSKESTKGITIVTGGDAGTALADFSTALVWSSKPSHPLPLLMIVLNNGWGISTNYQGQHSEENISDRGRAFKIQTYNVNGNDLFESYNIIKQAMNYVRTYRKPALLEARVSRLYGHSSASGANFVANEECCIKNLEKYLMQKNILNESEVQKIEKSILDQLQENYKSVQNDLEPSSEDVWKHIYAGEQEANWRKF